MQTNFSLAALADPKVAEVEAILRKCVHCGLCTATCPTYVTLGNELDSPRGRIYLIKDMFENGRPADAEIVTHIDRCLSCLACTTTCPSGVDYMHLVDRARAHIHETWRRPLLDRTIRAVLAMVLPYPARFHAALRFARLGKPFAGLFAAVAPLKPLAAMLALAPSSVAPRRPPVFALAQGRKRGRVLVMAGCASSVLDAETNEAAARLLSRFGVEVVSAKGEGCCGALVHHMGREADARAAARRNVAAWSAEIDGAGLDAIIVTASGCGTTVKDYGHLLAGDPQWAEKARRVAALAVDITEYLVRLDLPEPDNPPRLTVAYHAACSLQHGQKVTQPPKSLLARAGFLVREPREPHLCCGSAGTYNILQSALAETLKARKVRNLEATKPDVIAAGNIGCLTQIGSGTGIPVVHTVRLLDWAWGGPKPAGLK